MRTCETCLNEVTGRQRFCPACIKKRRTDAQSERNKAIPPPKRGTGYEWLDSFNGYIGSGLSYTEYQRREQGWR